MWPTFREFSSLQHFIRDPKKESIRKPPRPQPRPRPWPRPRPRLPRRLELLERWGNQGEGLGLGEGEGLGLGLGLGLGTKLDRKKRNLNYQGSKTKSRWFLNRDWYIGGSFIFRRISGKNPHKDSRDHSI